MFDLSHAKSLAHFALELAAAGLASVIPTSSRSIAASD